MMLVNNTCIVNLERKCRICAGDLLDLSCAIPIFSSICLDAKIQRYLYVKVSPSDELPKVICATCFIKIESIDKFAFLAAKTEETYYTWLKRAKDLNALKAAAQKNADQRLKDENQVDNNQRKQQQQHQTQLISSPPLSSGSSTATQKIILNTYRNPRNPRHVDHITLEQIINDQIVRNPKSLIKPGEPKPETSMSAALAYHDLKIGQLIKDEELLKLILKALRWVETGNKRYTAKYWVKKLKGSKFRDVLSNPNLLKDSDLMQLIKSYVGQDALTLFSSIPPPTVAVPYVTPPPHVTITSTPVSLIKTPPSRSVIQTTPAPEPDFKISDEVTQMEVGVDPSLFLGDDEDSTNGTSRGKSTPITAENTDSATNTSSTTTTATASEGFFNGVKLKTTPTHFVLANTTYRCSMCSESFPTNTELQNHVMTHLLRNPEDKNKRPEVEIHLKQKESLTDNKKKQKKRRKQEISTLNTNSLPEIELIPLPPTKKKKTEEKTSPTSPESESVIQQKMSPSRKSVRKPTTETESPNTTTVDKLKEKESSKEVKSKSSSSNNKKRSAITEKSTTRTAAVALKKKRTSINLTLKTTRSPTKPRTALKLSRLSDRKNSKPTCTKCSKIFKTRAEQLKHQKNCPNSVKFHCEPCKRTFPTKSSLSMHLLSHALQRKHKCITCRKNFKNVKDLKSHSATHNNQPSPSRKHLCPFCEKTYLTSSHLTTHKKRKHASQLEKAKEKAVSPPPKIVKRVKFSDDTKG